MPADSKLTLAEARAILGLPAGASAAAAKRAFRAAAMQAHPDRPGGDAARFRRVVAAHRALQAPALPAVRGPAPLMEARAVIGPLVALGGGEALAVFPNGRQLRVRIPAGARDGERLRIGMFTAVVAVIPEPDLELRGGDLWTCARAPAFLLAVGGRVAAPTPVGEYNIWIGRKTAERRLVRIPGAGLPARGVHPAGDLFIRLLAEPVPSESAARERLRRFAAAWAA
ncbi:MAG: molecular chaperone DnaJ [Caulobacteraceae bacterium]|nr:molecular chaperone DnaJ [Caulobacteraceae bacterium]